MADDKSNRGPADRARVNIHEPYEVEYWSKEFGVTRISSGSWSASMASWLRTFAGRWASREGVGASPHPRNFLVLIVGLSQELPRI